MHAMILKETTLTSFPVDNTAIVGFLKHLTLKTPTVANKPTSEGPKNWFLLRTFSPCGMSDPTGLQILKQ